MTRRGDFDERLAALEREREQRTFLPAARDYFHGVPGALDDLPESMAERIRWRVAAARRVQAAMAESVPSEPEPGSRWATGNDRDDWGGPE